MQQTGKILIIVGAIVIIVGIILWFGGNKLNWIGKLPGDIRIEKENFKFYMPITTMILLSVVVSLILWLIRKF
jgi:hypothetical protein